MQVPAGIGAGMHQQAIERSVIVGQRQPPQPVCMGENSWFPGCGNCRPANAGRDCPAPQRRRNQARAPAPARPGSPARDSPGRPQNHSRSRAGSNAIRSSSAFSGPRHPCTSPPPKPPSRVLYAALPVPGTAGNHPQGTTERGLPALDEGRMPSFPGAVEAWASKPASGERRGPGGGRPGSAP